MPLSTLADLRTEFLARGVSYLDDAGTTRQDQFLNQAYLELCEEDLWPFLETTASGAAPLAIPDLRSVLSVYESSLRRQLPYMARRDLVDTYGDVSTAGAPSYWYIDNDAIATFPVGGTLEVRYMKVPAELVDPTDVPVVPLRFRNLIIDGAMRRAYWDSDNFNAAQFIENERQASIERMRQSLLWQNNAQPEFVVVAHGTDW